MCLSVDTTETWSLRQESNLRPSTYKVGARASVSYGGVLCCVSPAGSNLRPSPSEGDALPLSYGDKGTGRGAHPCPAVDPIGLEPTPDCMQRSRTTVVLQAQWMELSTRSFFGCRSARLSPPAGPA